LGNRAFVSQLREFSERYTEAAWRSQDAARVASCYSGNGSLTVNRDELVSDGEQTVYRWTLVGTNTGPGGAGLGKDQRSGSLEDGSEDLIAESTGRYEQAKYDRQLKDAV
jgi:hypothetical protein